MKEGQRPHAVNRFAWKAQLREDCRTEMFYKQWDVAEERRKQAEQKAQEGQSQKGQERQQQPQPQPQPQPPTAEQLGNPDNDPQVNQFSTKLNFRAPTRAEAMRTVKDVGTAAAALGLGVVGVGAAAWEGAKTLSLGF